MSVHQEHLVGLISQQHPTTDPPTASSNNNNNNNNYNNKKLAPCRTDGRLLLQAKFLQVQSHMTQKNRKDTKNLARTNLDIVL